MPSFLTDTEQTWLYQNLDELSWAPEKDYFPFIYYEGGSVQGITYDFIQLLQNKLGVVFPTLIPDSLPAILQKARNQELGFITSVTYTEERDAFLDFTDPYLSVPVVLLTNAAGVQPMTLAEAESQAYTVGAGEDYGVVSYLQANYPTLKVVELPNDGAVLEALATGELDSAVVDVASASYQINDKGLDQLKVNDQIDFSYDLSFAVPQGEDQLVEILNKAMAQVTPEERQALLSTWSLKNKGTIGDFEAPVQGLGALSTSLFSVPTWTYVLFAGAVLLFGVALLLGRLLGKKRR